MAGATRMSTTSDRVVSVATKGDQADRLIPTILRLSCKSRASRQILSWSTSLSSGKDSTAMSMACWMGHSKFFDQQWRRRVRREEGTYVVVLSRGDVHHSRAVAVRQDIRWKSGGGACRISWSSRGVRTRTRPNSACVGSIGHGRNREMEGRSRVSASRYYAYSRR